MEKDKQKLIEAAEKLIQFFDLKLEPKELIQITKEILESCEDD